MELRPSVNIHAVDGLVVAEQQEAAGVPSKLKIVERVVFARRRNPLRRQVRGGHVEQVHIEVHTILTGFLDFSRQPAPVMGHLHEALAGEVGDAQRVGGPQLILQLAGQHIPALDHAVAVDGKAPLPMIAILHDIVLVVLGLEVLLAQD